jgi:hypothetical protein
MAAPTQDPTGYYIWEVPGQPVVVHLRLDVIDRLAAEAMGGFGSVPKRGAEVGGLLIGTAIPGVPTVVRIDDFEMVACEYRRGPSYLFTEEDTVAFGNCWGRWQPSASPSAYAVGYFRSHTRDGFSLEPEDLDLLDQFFPAATDVALLIKPYATKVSLGGFFIRENGVFPASTPLEFPFRRYELLGEEPPPRRPRAGAFPQEPMPALEPPFSSRAAVPARPRSGWVWFPLTFLFLLLGVALGYQLALTLGARASDQSGQDFSLSLSAKKNGDNLSVTWSRESPAVRSARKGLLEIDEGGYTKPVDLDVAQLQNGGLIYHNTSNAVRFRLTVYPQGRVSVVETLDWKQ